MESISAFMVGFFRAREAWEREKETRELGEGASEKSKSGLRKKESRLELSLFLSPLSLDSFEQAKLQSKRAKENGL